MPLVWVPAFPLRGPAFGPLLDEGEHGDADADHQRADDEAAARYAGDRRNRPAGDRPDRGRQAERVPA